MSQRPPTSTMRHVVQPGHPPAQRIQWTEARGSSFSFALEAGLPLLEAVRRGFAAAGFASGVLTIDGGALAPFAYVMPAQSNSPQHAAYYSETFRPAGVSQLKAATMTFGRRDGAPFFHCHALWIEADGRLRAGHVLPEETVLATSCRADAFGLSGAGFVAEQDPETNFKLFVPAPAPAPAAGATDARAFVLRLRPNQDFASALEAFCRARGMTQARLRGGVGSIIGARFADGRSVEPFATEMAVTSGLLRSDGQGLLAELDVFLVDHLGGIAEGRLTRGDNPILMTMELVLEG